ncbi:MAG: hypothetical protein IIC58_07470 [Proteobacteria bacterium]|nr:hypothetical protein [Pseudomonadota bacterium]
MAEIASGIGALKAVFAPLLQINFMPTGGIISTTAVNYLNPVISPVSAAPCVVRKRQP